MYCPDCKGSLVDITLTGIDKSYRCFRCGGIWVKDNTLSELSIKAMEDWRSIKFENLDLSTGNNDCPEDKIGLKKYKSEKVPETWNVRNCDKCKGWWWPTDTLFRIKDVVANNSGYVRVKEAII